MLSVQWDTRLLSTHALVLEAACAFHSYACRLFFIVAALALGLYHESEVFKESAVFKVNRYAARYPSYRCMYQQQVAQGIKNRSFLRLVIMHIL